LMDDITLFRHCLFYLIMLRLDIPEKIETDRLILQRLRYEDAEEIFYCYASKPDATKFLSWKTHSSVEQTRSFLRYAIESWNHGTDYGFSVRVKENRKLAGGFGLINELGKIQLGYVLSPTHWNQGYATEACKSVIEILKSLPVFRVGTFVDVDNAASIRVLEKCGLIQEARLEKWFRFVNQNDEPKDCYLYKFPL
jgi:[ribosomal protein S5]-alanine N-acetyltransferase